MTSSELAAPRVRRRGSLRRRLPLIISLLLMATVAASGWAAYIEVESAVLEAAQERLRGVARQLASLLTQSTTQRIEEGRRLVARPAFRRALDSGDDASLRDAKVQLDALMATSPQILSVELWRSTGERIAHTFSGATDDGPGLPSNHAYEPPRSAGFSPLRGLGEVLYSELAVSVPRATTDAAAATPMPPKDGFVVFRRRASGKNTAEAIRRLMGGGVSLRFGSRTGGIWTDLSKKVPAPPPLAKPSTTIRYAGENGEMWHGAEASVSGAPWSVWVEIPESTALETARSFWQRMARIGVAIVMVGTLFAWAISRRITMPLHALTEAAEAIAAGEVSKRVESDRRDEVGRLAEAFNTMTERVQEGYARLDTGIRERTMELEQTVAALQDAQEQLVRREKLAMLGQLASGVGHELRNPLGVMTNAVYYLEMVQPDAAPDIQEYHGILRAQIGLAEKIVGDLLDFSRLKAPRREDVSLAGLVDAQIARLTITPGTAVQSQVARELPLAHIDPVQIGQIVFNLLVNAMQAIEAKGGTVTLTASSEGGRLALAVQDDGPGVPEELKAKIFEPLFTTKARGIGLGLAVSRSLAEANGGALTLSDVPTGGACFTLTMPAVSSQEAAA